MKIYPFSGILYDKRKVRDIPGLFSPPYDVISAAEQNRLYRRHPYNAVRLILGKTKPSDLPRDNRYTRACRYFEDWLEKGILKQDSRPGIYPYRLTFRHAGKKKRVRGFFVLLRLPEKKERSGVLPHEKTHSAPKEDRFNLIKETRANLEPIYLLFDDTAGVIERIYRRLEGKKPVFKFRDGEGTRHELFRLSERKMLAEARRALSRKQVLIADGHHRYEVSLRFRDYLKAKGEYHPRHPAGRQLIFLAALDDPGLVILPTHRIVKGVGEKKLTNFLKSLRHFALEELSSPDHLFLRLAGNESHILGVGTGRRTYLLKAETGKLLAAGESPLQRTESLLDVGLLHRFIIEPLVGKRDLDKKIIYTRDARFARDAIGRDTAVFFLKPTTISEVKVLARAKRKMPQKSTYFYPKLASGLVFYSFGERHP